jgi:hypothetical protein
MSTLLRRLLILAAVLGAALAIPMDLSGMA